MDVRRKVAIFSIMIVLVVAALCTGGCGTAMPDVKGKTAAQAEKLLVAAGFQSGKVTYDPAYEGADGAVVAQDPKAGTRSRPGTIVNLTVAGNAPVTVPSVVGMPRDAARIALANEGLLMGDAGQSYSSTAAAGVVMAQEPVAGAEAPKDSSIDVFVSIGPEPAPPAKVSPEPAEVKVPPVKGLKLAAAKAKIEAAGLTWNHELGPGDGMTDVGFVYKQVPAAGAEVTEGSSVTLLTWEGP